MIKKLTAKYAGEIKLSVSTMVSQLLQVVTLPILMKLITPESYGSYGLFYSVAAMVSPLVCLKYDTAIVTAQDEKDAAMLAVGCGMLCFAAGGLMSVLLTVLSLVIELPFWSWLLVPTLFFSGLHQGAAGVCLRGREYGRIAAAGAVRSGTLAVAQLALCRIVQVLPQQNLSERYIWGLTGGLLLSWITGCLPLLVPGVELVRRHRESIRYGEKEPVCLRQIMKTLRRYLSFVRFTLPAAGAASVAANLLSPVISVFYGSAMLGCYSVAVKALGTPITVISQPIAQVYFRDVSQKMTSERIRSVFRLLLLLAIPLYMSLFFLAEPVLPLLFGEAWRKAAWLIRLLTPLYAVRFVTVPLFSTAIAVGKQREAFRWQKRLLAAVMLSLVVVFISPIPFSLLMISYSAALGWCSIAFCRYNFRIVPVEVKKDGVEK